MSLALSFPGGHLKTVEIPATAGNVVTTISPGVGVRWIIQYGEVNIDSDGNAGNRKFVIEITDGTDTVLHLGDNDNAITANQKGVVIIMNPQGMQDWTMGTPGFNVTSTLPISGLLLEGADELQIEINNGLAGDSYEGFIRVLALGITP